MSLALCRVQEFKRQYIAYKANPLLYPKPSPEAFTKDRQERFLMERIAEELERVQNRVDKKG